jgi:hypothetical protein
MMLPMIIDTEDHNPICFDSVLEEDGILKCNKKPPHFPSPYPLPSGERDVDEKKTSKKA